MTRLSSTTYYDLKASHDELALVVRLHRWITETRLKPGARQIMHSLILHASDVGSLTFAIANGQIVERSGLVDSTVRDTLGDLADNFMLVKVPLSGFVNTITLTPPPEVMTGAPNFGGIQLGEPLQIQELVLGNAPNIGTYAIASAVPISAKSS